MFGSSNSHTGLGRNSIARGERRHVESRRTRQEKNKLGEHCDLHIKAEMQGRGRTDFLKNRVVHMPDLCVQMEERI